jgi:hypothetical protein
LCCVHDFCCNDDDDGDGDDDDDADDDDVDVDDDDDGDVNDDDGGDDDNDNDDDDEDVDVYIIDYDDNGNDYDNVSDDHIKQCSAGEIMICIQSQLFGPFRQSSIIMCVWFIFQHAVRVNTAKTVSLTVVNVFTICATEQRVSVQKDAQPAGRESRAINVSFAR